MIKRITKETLRYIKNFTFRQYAQIYTNIESSTLTAIENYGVSLSKLKKPEEKKEKQERLQQMGATFRNNDKSIVLNKISPACVACQTGSASYTTFVSLKCKRNCYFCFNKNQDDYNFYLHNQKDVKSELRDLISNGIHLNHLGLTGGEPLLHPEETVGFFQLANDLTPMTYTRLYTSGDLLSEPVLDQLRMTNLDEIRFSIKLEDSEQKHILRNIMLAKQFIPHVMVEMPVIPGTLEKMKDLLLTLDELEIYGINLLEFCFPLENGHFFKQKGFTLKNPPYDIYYNYWYAGGLAVDESEELCYQLIEFAIEQKLRIGIHYCSLENKFTGQVYQQNHNQGLGELYHFSEKDYFFKSAKIFGKDIKSVSQILSINNIPFEENHKHDFLQFPIKGIQLLKNRTIEIAIASSVAEYENGDRVIREVALDWTTPVLFEEYDL